MRPDDLPMESLRVPPHSIEAEQGVLGALFMDNAAFDRVADLLVESDFYRHENRLVWVAIASLVSAGKPADIITVFERLQAAGHADDIGGLAHLDALARCVPGASNVRRYAEIVREQSVRRQLIAVADQAATLAFSGAESVAEVLDRTTTALSALERKQHRKEPRLLVDSLAAALDRYNAIAEGTLTPGWSTGFAPLDATLAGGLKRGKVYGFAARPSVGKSSVARTISLRLATDGRPVLLLSQEMGRDELTDCYIAELGGIDGSRLATGRMADDDWSRVATAADAVVGLPLWIDDEGGLTLSDIRSKAKAVKGVQCVILDYLQLSRSTLKGVSTNDQIADLSRGLKALAMELDIPVIVLSQLNRDVEKRADKEPMLADLRDSGAIEQDLDVCVMLWTVIDESDRDNRRLVGWKVAKHRGGKKGRFGMRWLPASNRWTETDESVDRARGGEQHKGKFE